MSDNSIAILQAAEAYRKQLQVRNKWLEAERELRKKLDVAREEINQANKALEVASNNLSAQAGGYAPVAHDLRSEISDAVRESHVIRQGC